MISRRIGYLAWLAAAAVLYFFENNTGTRAVLAASVAAPFFSLCCAAWTAKKAKCSLRVPDAVVKGETISIGCAFSAPWTRIGCALSCQVHSEHRMNHLAGTWEIEDSGKGFSMNCAHCGTEDFFVETAKARDWLDLARFPCRASDRDSLLILPDLYPVKVNLPAQVSLPWQGESPGCPQRRAGETENSGVRDYAPGDPVRRIHWKLSGKMDRVLIREEDRPLAGSILLLLETSGYDNNPEDMDSAAEALLSASREMAIEGIVHSVSWMDGGRIQWREIACAEDHTAMQDALLRAYGSEAGESVGAAFCRAFPEFRADHAVIFSPRPDTDALSLLETGIVTLVLPRPEAGSPDLRVARVSREEPELDL